MKNQENTIDTTTDVERQARGPMTRAEREQLKNVCEAYPVAAGDLIGKHEKAVLAARGYVEWRPGTGRGIGHLPGGSDPEAIRRQDGERLGGYVPTEAGLEACRTEGR